MTPPTLAWLLALAGELDEDRVANLDLPALARVMNDAGDVGLDPCDQAGALLVGLARLGHRRLAAMAAIGWVSEAGFGVESDPDTHERLRKLVAAAADGRHVRAEAAAALREHITDKKGKRLFERFTDRARRILTLSQAEAQTLGTDFIGTEHFLLAMMAEGEGVAAKALASLGYTLESTRVAVRSWLGDTAGGQVSKSPPFTPRAKKVLELSLREALQLGHNYIGTEHILLGIVREGEGLAARVLGDLSAVRRAVIQQLVGVAVPATPTDPVFDLYRVDVAATEQLAADIEADLQLLVREGDQKARERVISANLRLVLDHVLHQPPGAASALDMIQAGNHALTQSVDAWAAAAGGTSFADIAMPRIAEAVAEASTRAMPDAPSCSFCRKSQKEVQRLIAGPGVYICNDCITLSNDIINEEQVTTAQTARCSRCRADLSYAGRVSTVTVDDTELLLFMCRMCHTVLGTV